MLTLKNLSLTAADAQGRADIVKNVSLDVEDGKFPAGAGHRPRGPEERLRRREPDGHAQGHGKGR